MTQGADYGASFASWRAGAGEVWRDYTRHAFVRDLGTGTLPRASFLHYLIQDYVYLVHFSRAWALAVVKSATLDEMQACAATVDALVNREMSLHVTTCAAEGITEQALFDAAEEDENLAYTRYVMDAGLSGDFLDLMAALAPCVMGYGEIGLWLKDTAHPATPYGDWIATYASDDYQTVCRNVGALIDAAVARRLGGDPQSVPRWQTLQTRFSKATALEVGFWNMGLRGGAEPAQR
ncbi:thiaminase II [Brevirhabdus sp.]|uniref:thiaminase II n=1 Tax=Brevirhabdus sp. TaxID=2004514 RepID=UPI004058BFAE